MSRIGGFRIPPISAALNVAKQTVLQMVPGKQGHETMPEGGPQERVRFAQQQQPVTTGGSIEHCEMSNMSMNNQWSPTSDKAEAEDSFNQGFNKQPSLNSIDFSEDDFQEGKLDVKINEYQAAWNVTNAIQVRPSNQFCHF